MHDRAVAQETEAIATRACWARGRGLEEIICKSALVMSSGLSYRYNVCNYETFLEMTI